MKKQITISVLLFSSLGTFAQVTKEDLTKEIKPLTEKVKLVQSESNKLQSELIKVNSIVLDVKRKLTSLEEQVHTNASNAQSANSELNSKIINSETITNKKFSQVDNSLSKNSLWSIIGILAAIIVSGLVYWLVSKRQTNDKTDVEAQISKTKKTLEEEGVKLDTK